MKFNYKIWCKLFNVLSVWWYIKFYDVFFVFFCCFTAAQSNVIQLGNAYNIFWTRRRGTSKTLAGHVTRFKMAEDICTIFSLPSLSTFVQRSHKIIWIDRTFSKSKGKFFMKIILSSKYSWKRNRFSIMIVNKCETRNEWLTLPELSFDVTDGHGLKWCIKMDKLFLLGYLSLCFIKLGVVWLCIFCVVMQFNTWVVWNKQFVYI